MQFTADGLIASIGEYGPFSDGRRIPYVDFVAADGSGIFRATLAEAVTPPAALSNGTATIEVRRRDDGKLSLRLAVWKPGAKLAAVA